MIIGRGVVALAIAWATAALLLAGCGGNESKATAASAQGGSSSTTAAALGADHDCVVGGTGNTVDGARGGDGGDGGDPPVVRWTDLHNPILSYPTGGVKDQALVWAGGEWHMLFSYVTNDVVTPGAEQWDIASATSPDLVHWSAPSPWPTQAGVTGVASPDLVRSPSGMFVATYDSNPDVRSGPQSKLYYRTSTDLETWSPPRPLAPGLHPAPGDRMIDAALAWTGHGLILGYKYGTTAGTTGTTADAAGTTAQHFEIAWSPSGSLDGPWSYVGRPDIVVNGDTIENYEFVAVAGHWRLVATSTRSTSRGSSRCRATRPPPPRGCTGAERGCWSSPGSRGTRAPASPV